jgi:hypothetical protein
MNLRRAISRSAYFGLCFLALLGANIPAASAQNQNSPSTQGINIQISPLPIELKAKPGTSTSTDLRVRNASSSAQTLKVSLRTFTQEGPEGEVILHDPTPADEHLKWVSFDKPTFNAPPGQWQTVKMTVNVPKSAAFGYYYAVQFELANPPKPKAGEAGLRGAVAIFVLLNAETNGQQRQAQVTSFSADHKSYEFLPANFKVQVHNSGKLHVAPKGNIFIKRGSKQIANISVNATGGNVLPNSNRVYTAPWSDGFPVYETVLDSSGQPVRDKDGNPKKQLKWDFPRANKLRFGHYTAELVLVYNDGQRDVPINGSLSFWVIPWRIIGMLLGALALVAALVIYIVVLRRKLKRVKHR